uniref:SLC13 family permease n=1 Tax=Halomonas sp. TaxID=1486246 RepID=UPI00262C7196|nr:SLC13 family permease [Halomonas sp.]
MAGRWTLIVFCAALIAWVKLDVSDTAVALLAALALVVPGVVDENLLFQSLGNDIIWLLIAAFVIASVLSRSGIAERLASRCVARCGRVSSVFWTITLVTASTAFLIPSTSARAAIMLPLFMALAEVIGRPRVTRALSLLFPSVILLSAGASLTGAGAHLVAMDFMAKFSHEEIGFVRWAMLAGPFALLTSLISCALIQWLFLSREDRSAPLGELAIPGPAASASTPAVIAIMVLTIGLWITSPLHGQSMAIIALVSALALSTPAVSGVSLKTALKDVEWGLLLFMASTLMLGQALMTSGAITYITEHVLARMLTGPQGPAAWLVITLTALIASLAHLLITSRTARASVLIPAVAFPLAATGVNPVTLMLVITLGTGFCQTLPVSAKPVALFSSAVEGGFEKPDLLRLATILLPIFMGLLIVLAIFIWPLLGLPVDSDWMGPVSMENR